MSIPIENVRSIPAEETYSLRHRILRPTQLLAECAYPEDKAEHTYHAGYYRDQQLLGVGTIFRAARPESTLPTVWRIRGMAVSEEAQGLGIGGKVLSALLAYAASQGMPAEVWCNGRANVQGFYERFG
ncbi:MAG: GNAT family N-acetyltransferase, partial [Ktedonobacteraceae bacterium]